MRHRFPLPPTLLSLLFALALAPAAPAQAAGSDYTASMPSVAKIKAQLQGGDPIDTEARQAAIFEYLPIYIQRIKETRDYRGPYSAGEQKLLTDYAQALYAIQQDIKTKHTPDEAKRYQQLEGQYSLNNALGWIKQLEGQQAADTYRGAESSLAQTYNQHEAQMQKQMQQDNGQGTLLGGFLAGGGVQSLKPEQKRCLELGGTINQCANPIMGLASGIGNLISGIMGGGDSDTPPPPPLTGVLLVGYYHSRTDLPEIALNTNGGAVLKRCGTLVDVGHEYTLRKSGGTVQLVVDNEPDPIVLTLRPDGSLSGPGNIAVKGFIVTGYHDVTTCGRGTCSTTSTPIYAPSMQRCTISQFAPQPAPPPPPKPKPGSLAEAFPGNSAATVYGFRVTGPYASSSGMKLDFNDAFVTLDCGQAHINASYTVDNTPTGFVVHVQNGGGAFLLGVAPDNTLLGTGSTTVNGKLVSGLNGEVVSFTPHAESCGVGTFTPASNKNTMVASRGPAATLPASSAATSSPAAAPEPAPAPNPIMKPASTTSSPSAGSLADSLAGAGISGSAAAGTPAAFRVLLSSQFSGANPLAGQAVFVSRKPMNQILRELGVAFPAQATPAQAMKALQAQCHAAQGCGSVIQGMAKYYVATTRLDTSGKATLSATAATGPYYFFAIVPGGGGGSLMWDVLANLAAGENKVTFTQANADRVN